jgi:hypothetical protein
MKWVLRLTFLRTLSPRNNSRKSSSPILITTGVSFILLTITFALSIASEIFGVKKVFIRILEKGTILKYVGVA